MVTDQKPRIAIVDVVVGADGIATGTTLVLRSGSGIYDERVRGYWKDRHYVPALDADGRPREDTLRITNNYSFVPGSRDKRIVSNHTDSIEGVKPSDAVARISRNVDDEARQKLIGQWKEVTQQVVGSCRTEPASNYWDGVFSAELAKRL